MLKNCNFIYCFVIALFLFFSCNQDEIPVEILPPYINIGSVNDITKYTATIEAIVFPNGDSVSVFFLYAPQNESTWKTDTLKEKLNGSKILNVSIGLKNLVPNTIYKCLAMAINNKGDTALSFEQQFLTKDFLKTFIYTFPVENITLNSAQLSAFIIPGEDSTTICSEYSSEALSNWLTANQQHVYFGSDTVKLKCNLSNLQSNTEYYLRWKAVNKGGTYIKVDTFTTFAFTDFDGNLYHAIRIGKQTWMVPNLRTTHFANGDPIPYITDPNICDTLTSPAYCLYNNDPKLGEIYGGLYNFYVGVDKRGLIDGWHVPSQGEFVVLALYLERFPNTWAGPSLMEVGTAHWINPISSPSMNNMPPNNKSGFTALPNGAYAPYKLNNKWIFMNLGECFTSWTTDEMNGNGSMAEIDNFDCFFNVGALHHKQIYLGLRLIKDSQ